MPLAGGRLPIRKKRPGSADDSQHFFQAFDPGSFVDPEKLAKELATSMDEITQRCGAGEIRFPGDQDAARAAKVEAEGIPLDGAVYEVRAESIDTTIRRRFSTREFTLLRGDRPQRSVEYPWPWYREPFASGAPGSAGSADFMREMSAMIREYGGRQ